MSQEKQASVYEFAMIGHPGAGKTTLAAGLYASVGKDFVTIPSQSVGDYVNTACAGLRGHQWPLATQGVPTKLCFTVLHNQRKYQIRFDDFPGEKISEDSFIRDVVKKSDGSYPDGVLLLVNCAAAQMDEPLKAEEMQADFRTFVAEMGEHHVPIALVVTAWDRMATDRKARQAEFERFLAPLAAILESFKCRWKRFNVSVTGKLEDQERPDLAPCDVEKPFLWLLHQQPEMTRLRRGKLLLLILVVLLAAAGIFGLYHLIKSASPKKDHPGPMRPNTTTSPEPQEPAQPQPPPLPPDVGADMVNDLTRIFRQSMDPPNILQNWADVEKKYEGKVVERKIKEINDLRRSFVSLISRQVFDYAQDFKLRELKKLCGEIASYESDIPYLKGRKLMSFAKDFRRWHDEFKVRVTASVESVKEDKNCWRVDTKFSKLKPKSESQWNEGNPAQTIVIDPDDSVEYEVGFQSIYTFQNDKVQSRSFSFSPARDEVEEQSVSKFGYGYSIKYKFDVSSLAKNGFPVRFVDFLKRYGKDVDALCGEDND